MATSRGRLMIAAWRGPSCTARLRRQTAPRGVAACPKRTHPTAIYHTSLRHATTPPRLMSVSMTCRTTHTHARCIESLRLGSALCSPLTLPTRASRRLRTRRCWENAAPAGDKGTFLETKYRDKDEVKALGARWEPHERKWYVPTGVSLRPFAKWLRADQLHTAGLRGHSPDSDTCAPGGYTRMRARGTSSAEQAHGRAHNQECRVLVKLTHNSMSRPFKRLGTRSIRAWSAGVR